MYDSLRKRKKLKVEDFQLFYVYVSHSYIVSNFIYASKAR